MAVFANGQIELIDLTDTRGAMLHLTTSLSRIQTETNGTYQPDYINSPATVPEYNTNTGLPTGGTRTSPPPTGMFIIPSLYFGQELISIYKYRENITYLVDGIKYSYIKDSSNRDKDVFINDYGELVYKKNLDTVANLTILAEIEKYEDGMDYYEDIQSQIDLVKVSTLNFLPMLDYDRNIFSDINSEDITLKGLMYKNGQEYSNTTLESDRITYNWRISPEDNEAKLGKEQTQTISRAWVDNLATVFCDMYVKENGQTYTTQVTISDKTDPLSGNIISSKGMAFTGTEETTDLTCDIYQGTMLLNKGVSYAWEYFHDGLTDFQDLLDSNGKQYTTKTVEEILPQNYKASSVTFRCTANYKSQGIVVQTVILISQEIKTVITPIQNFIETLEDGSLPKGVTSFSKIINFTLTDSVGNLLPRFKTNDLQISSEYYNDETKTDYFQIEFFPNSDNDGKTLWDYTIKVSFSETDKVLFKNLDSSILFTIEYKHLGLEFSDEFYFVKNIQGKDGINGTSDRLYILYSKTGIPTSESDISTVPIAGFSYIGTNITEATTRPQWNEEGWVWSKFEGSDGNDGNGAYIFVVYSSFPEGVDELGEPALEEAPTEDTKYMGTCIKYYSREELGDNNEPTAPETPNSYSWSEIKGEGVASITRYYSLRPAFSDKPSIPEIVPPDANYWNTTEPTFLDGNDLKYSLYFVDLVKYTDGTYQYSEVSISSHYEAAKIAYSTALEAKQEIDRAMLWFTFDNDLGFIVRKPAYTDENGVEHAAAIWYTITDNKGYHIYRTDKPEAIGSFMKNGLLTDTLTLGELSCYNDGNGGWVWS